MEPENTLNVGGNNDSLFFAKNRAWEAPVANVFRGASLALDVLRLLCVSASYGRVRGNFAKRPALLSPSVG